MLSTIRSDYKAAETYSYTPGATLDCPITAIVGDNDPQATTAEAATWAEHSTADFDLRIFPGGHFYLTEHKEAVASLIAATLVVRH